MTFVVLGWLVLGWCGAALLWMDWKMGVDRKWPVCPTPRAIIAGAVFGVVGPFLLVVGLSVLILTWLTNTPKRLTWWSTPVCGE